MSLMCFLLYRLQVITVLAFTLSIHFSIGASEKFRCDFTKVWGPGLDPENVVLPARYFFIESHDENGNRFTKTPGKDVFSVKIYSPSPTQPSCTVHTEVLDRHDGSFIVRYKIYSTCLELIISLKCLGIELSNSPYHIKNKIFPETCPCTLNSNIEDWFRKFGCKDHYNQIETDLRPFKSIDTDEIFKIAEKTLFKDVHRHSICNYVIKKNQIYRKCYGQYTGFKMFMDAILLFVTRRVQMPDIEILVNLGDWPLITDKVDFNSERILIPVFSWCGSNDSWDIVLPTYDITESSLENMGRVSLDMLSVQGNTGPTWENKIPQLFWRGRDSSRERLKLIKISQQNTFLINASLTDFFFFRDEQVEYGPREKRVSFFHFFKFKYQLNMDGTVAAYRFPYLLAGDSLVFKQESPYYEFFYEELTKWKHYIPVKRDLSDLLEKLEWALNHDEEAHKIALNGQTYARENLLPHHIFCYHVMLFYEYSKKQITDEIKIRAGMEMVNQNNLNDCECESFSIKKSEPTKYEEL